MDREWEIELHRDVQTLRVYRLDKSGLADEDIEEGLDVLPELYEWLRRRSEWKLRLERHSGRPPLLKLIYLAPVIGIGFLVLAGFGLKEMLKPGDQLLTSISTGILAAMGLIFVCLPWGSSIRKLTGNYW